ncbi:LON peptidase substrate-binding domain-containing protein [Guyparkeria sp.]|uniref:LON peptidase substrate-binding domain-containing protein n=1 Tax=Guyparkeria sp. TaxID=2035736 RepID=UPI0039704881
MLAEGRFALFPLRAMLFPAGQLSLRLFEARYLDLLRECLREDRPFGVVRITAGREVGTDEGAPSIANVGTSAHVLGTAALPGCLLGVMGRGERRCRVIEHAVDVCAAVRARVEFSWAAPTSGDSVSGESTLGNRRQGLIDALARLDPAILESERDGDVPALAWPCYRLAERLPLGWILPAANGCWNATPPSKARTSGGLAWWEALMVARPATEQPIS